METLKNNIVKIYGKRGEGWLSELPRRIEQLQRSWGLSELKPFPNLSYSYVLAGLQSKVPVILKLSPDANLIDKEAMALNAFEGFGAVSVLDREEGVLLLEQAVPGGLLKNSLPIERRIEIACKVIDKLHQAPIPPKEGFPSIEEWLAAVDKEWDLPKDHLKRARKLKNELINKDSGRKVLLHGDLHQENILSNGNDWVVIDPKGVIGAPIHEIWACVEDPNHDLKFLATNFGYPFQDVVEWYYVRLILASCWQAEDGLDASRFLTLAQSVLPLVEP
jgi:streptomycin 6-kinase